jgi:ATP-dependent protease HslVU (ClpYQ) peptidase subunit
MTCLIGVVQDGKTYIGTDGYATSEDCERKPIVCRKLFVSDKYLVAFAGHIRTGQLLYPESGFEFPKDIYQIPNHMYLWLREFEAVGKDEAQMSFIQSNFLIATKDKLYEILMDLSISEIDPECGFTAMGSGCPYAMGSLHTSATTHKDNPILRIKMALSAATEFIKNVGPPYQIYSYPTALKTLKSKFMKQPTKRTRTKKTKK